MWKSFGTIALLLHCATTELRFDVKAVANPKFFGNFNLDVNQDTLNMSMNIIRIVEGKITVSFSFM
jgi:hypothetical protein